MANASKHIIYWIAKVTTILLSLLIFIFSTIDTHMFVYPSLSRSLISELSILCLMIMTLLYCAIKKKCFICSKTDWFLLAWIAYIVIHHVYVYPHEQYRTLYLIISLFSIPAISVLLRNHLLTRAQCENIVLSTASIHVAFVVMQWIGITESGNEYFALTGSNENPNVTSLYLVGCTPVIVARIYNGGDRVLHSSLLFICLVTIAVLRCRTAYIGLFVELLTATIMFFRKRSGDIPYSCKLLLFLAMTLAIITAGIKLYDMKRDSADGRALIWNISVKMITERPQGYGYGLFEKYYNIRQAIYFANGNGTDREKLLAGHVAMPYNDFLEHGVEGGVAGMLFLIAFYYGAITMAWRKQDMVSLSILAAFAIMSLTNFVYSSIQPWLLLMLHTSFVTSQTSKEKEIQQKTNNILSTIITMFIIACTSHLIRMTTGQMKLLEYKDCIIKGEYVSDDEIASIESDVGTSEAYWTIRAYNALLQEKYSEAANAISKALNYTSAPQTMEMSYQAYRLCGNEEQGILYMKKLRNMIPCLLHPKLQLLQYYDKHGNTCKATLYAREIMACHVKVDNDKTTRIRSAAYDYIVSHK